MIRSNTGGNAILSEDGRPYGVLLEADFTAEHEMPLRRLHSMFGIIAGTGDFRSYCATHGAGPQAVLLDVDVRHRTGRRTITDHGTAMWLSGRAPHDHAALLRRYDDAPLVGAWSEDSMALCGYGPGEDVVRMMHEGAVQGDFAVWLGGTGTPFSRAGLVAVRPSLTPVHLIETFDAAQADRRSLQEAALATGIAARLDAFRVPIGRGGATMPRHLALVPSWTDSRHAGRTAHPVVFWLNPMPGVDANFGYFTVEELDQWTQGKGPVPRSA